jgi:Trp operon repressor
VTSIGPDLRDRIVDELARHRTAYRTIAAKLGVSEATVRGIASANGFTAIGRADYVARQKTD